VKVESTKQKALKIISQLRDDSSWGDILAELRIAQRNEANSRLEGAEDFLPMLNEFSAKLKGVLQAEMPSAQDIVVEPASDGERVKGVIISEEFAGIDDADRQDQVWDILESKLSESEQRRVLSLIAYTPEEYRAFKEE
jgi:acid stress-induced BolA-like protein IbaG/YrbA